MSPYSSLAIYLSLIICPCSSPGSRDGGDIHLSFIIFPSSSPGSRDGSDIHLSLIICPCSPPGSRGGGDILAELWVGAELRQGQVLPVALLRDRPPTLRVPSLRVVSVHGVSFAVIFINIRQLSHLLWSYLGSKSNMCRWLSWFLNIIRKINLYDSVELIMACKLGSYPSSRIL